MLLRPFDDERVRLESSVRVRRKTAVRVDPILREREERIGTFGILGKQRDAAPHRSARSLRVFNSHDLSPPSPACGPWTLRPAVSPCGRVVAVNVVGAKPTLTSV